MESRNKKRKARHLRIRKKIIGTSNKPRLSVFKSNTAVSVQLIDDVNGHTLASSSTKNLKLNKSIESCKLLGKDIAIKAKKIGITTIVFDISGYKYHGKLAAIADSVRENGIKV